MKHSNKNEKKKKNFVLCPSQPPTMARDEVDISLITSERRKRKLASYVTNKDNISADKAETVKQLKKTVNPASAVPSG